MASVVNYVPTAQLSSVDREMDVSRTRFWSGQRV